MRIWDAANYFVAKVDMDAGETMTHLKLQKLLYYAQAWHLAIHSEPAFDNEFQAWVHGPVCPDVFQEYRNYGHSPIPYPEVFEAEDVLSCDEIEFLDSIWDVYGKYDAKYLERLTHQEDPWRKTRKGLSDGVGCDRPIDHELMAAYYRSLWADE